MLLGVDTGGTFTDFVLLDGEQLRLHKVLSTPDDPARSILRGIEELGLAQAVRDGRVTIVHGSTVATNAALERRGARTAFVTNRGFTDLLRIGRQARTALYSLTPDAAPDPVPGSLVIGTGGRIAADGTVLDALTHDDLDALRRQIVELQPEAVAINLLHSYVDDTHERAIEAALAGLAFVSRSSFVLPEYREYERGIATWLNAWLGPVVQRYLIRLMRGVAPARVAIMQSSGGTIDAATASRRAVNLLLSGPVAGLAAARGVRSMLGTGDLLTFDMGGTSTDVALVSQRVALTNEARIGPYPVAIPMADIHTIGAGGGSIGFLDSAGALHVGPRSAGAAPGPACYGFGGTEPTVTDANVVLGRLPATLTLAGRLPLHAELARRAFGNIARALAVTPERAALGAIEIANQHMVQALRVISLERGHDPRRLTLVGFGGAAGLHACALADALEIPAVIVPVHAGAFSAFGMLLADPARAAIKTVNLTAESANAKHIEAEFDALAGPIRRELIDDSGESGAVVEQRSVDLRYRGQTFTLTVPWTTLEAAVAAFHAAHAARYGHALDLPVELVNVRCDASIARDRLSLPKLPDRPPGAPRRMVPVIGHDEVPLFERAELSTHQCIVGPAIIAETMATTFVDERWEGRVDDWGHLHLTPQRREGREPT